MRQWLLFILAIVLLPVAAHARAFFAPKEEMISNSVVVAVVDITDVKSLEPNAMQGDQQVQATVKETIAGQPGTNLMFRVPSFYPCAVTQVTNGTYLVFLSKGQHGLQGNNWHLSYRPVKDGKIEWYKSDSPYELEWKPKEDVLREVRKAKLDFLSSIPTSVSEAVVLLLRSRKPSSDVDQALAAISEYENKSMRLQETVEAADGSLHAELEQRFPALGLLVYHSDQKFTHASRIPTEDEASNK